MWLCARSGGPKRPKLFIRLISSFSPHSPQMSPEHQHQSTPSARPSAPRLGIKTLRPLTSILNIHFQFSAPSHHYSKLLAMSSNPVERSQSRGREPLVYVSPARPFITTKYNSHHHLLVFWPRRSRKYSPCLRLPWSHDSSTRPRRLQPRSRTRALRST